MTRSFPFIHTSRRFCKEFYPSRYLSTLVDAIRTNERVPLSISRYQNRTSYSNPRNNFIELGYSHISSNSVTLTFHRITLTHLDTFTLYSLGNRVK